MSGIKIAIALLLIIPIWAFSQTHNMQLLSNIRFSDNCSDIWGYVDSTGREYAFVGRVTGTSVFDVTDPTRPVELQFIAGSVPNSWREIKTYKNRAYVTTERGSDGMLIINMSQVPTKITWTFFHPLITVNDKILNISKTVVLNTAHDLIIDDKGICYLHGSNVHNGLVMFDLNKNPDVPEYIGIFNPSYSHGGEIRRDTFWSADIIAGEATVWDIKDKSKPKKIANQRTGNAFTHSIALSDDSKYMFTTDERANAYLESYQVDNLSNITVVDRYRSHAPVLRNTIPHNIFYNKGFIVEAYYTDGFTLVDASDPTQLVEVGAFDTYPLSDGDFHGCWGIYPYLPSGNILVSDIEFGFYIIKPSYIHASYMKGNVKDSVTGIPLTGANIRIDKVPYYEVLSTANGTFKTGGPYQGNVSVLVSKSGYETKTISLNVETGKISNTEVALKPLSSPSLGLLNIKVIDATTKLPISNAQTRLEKPNESFLIKMLPDGTNQFQVSEGNWTIRAGAWGYRYNTVDYHVVGVNQTLTIELKPGYEDNYTFDFGWTAQSTANSGIWVRAAPGGTYHRTGTPVNPNADIAADFGEQCMITGNNSTNVIADDVDGGSTRLISPAINLIPIDKPLLNFYAWTGKLNVIDTIPAVGSHKVYIASGTDTLLVDSIPGNTSAWTYYQYKIDKSKLKNLNSISVLFEASEPLKADYRNILEFGVDGFSITDASVTAATNIQSFKTKLSIFPNPWTSALGIHVQPDLQDRSLQLISLDGKLLYQTRVVSHLESIIINPDIPPGHYIIQLLKGGIPEASTRAIKIAGS